MKYTKYLSVLLFATLLSQYSMAADDYPEECAAIQELMLSEAGDDKVTQNEIKKEYEQSKKDWNKLTEQEKEIETGNCIEMLSMFQSQLGS